MSLNCSANYNSGAANTIARSVNSLKFLWYNNCWEIGATRGDDTAIQALVFARQGNTYLAMTCHGAACFACELTAKTLGTNDLILNNLNYECANYVDGTRGSWLIQEGACDLFIINQVSCKKYKFNLIEIK